MILVDAHQDIAYNAVCFGRDYRMGAIKKRLSEARSVVPTSNGIALIGLPEAIVGRIGIVFATLFVAPYSKQAAPWSAVMYETPQEAYQLAMQQLDYYEKLADEDERIVLIKTASDLDEVIATWSMETGILQHKQGLVLLMENADPVLEPKQFEEWYERGVRIVGPAWKASRYASGTGVPGPLTDLGHKLLDVMMKTNAILDLSHLAEQAYSEALEKYDGQIIASHSNPRKFCNTDRHLSDEMILRLAERNGVMGVAMWNHFIDQHWTSSDGKEAITLERVVEVIDHICQLIGNAKHVGIGTDFDGGFGRESVPYEIDTVADLWQLKGLLTQRGFNDGDVEAILGGNMLRILRGTLR